MLTSADREDMARDLAFGNLVEISRQGGIDPDEYRAQQFAAVGKTTPHMMAANILAAGLMTWVAWQTSVSTVVVIWSVCLTAVSAFVLVTGWLKTSKWSTGAPQDKRTGVKAVRRAEIYAALLGGLWAALPAASISSAPPGVSFIIMGVTMGACGLGAFNLSRIPSAALIYGCIVTSALAGSAFGLGTRVGIAAVMLGSIYGFALSVMILKAHALALQRASDQKSLENHNDIIKLLLRDFESITKDWLWETDASGKLRYASERFIQLTGEAHGEVIGMTLQEALSDDGSSGTWTKLNAMMDAREAIVSVDMTVRIGDEQTWWQINAVPVLDDSQTFAGYRGVAVDITDVRRSADELVCAKQAAERASAAKSQFLAVMSHELRTPLNSILGYAELAMNPRHEPVNEAERDEYICNILDHSRHLSRLINDILDITRIERGKVKLIEQEVDVDELVSIITRMCNVQAREADVELCEDYQISGMVVQGDLTRLKQILINIISNAIKFTARGGKVEISVDRSHGGEPQITVRDSGIGIEPSKIPEIFEPFVQAEDAKTRHYEGAGLGLAITRELARLHDGDVTLDSELGKGTTARLTLPTSRLVKPRQPVAAA